MITIPFSKPPHCQPIPPIEEVEILKAELEAEHRRLFHEWCVAPNGSAEDDEAGLRYKAIRERWEAVQGAFNGEGEKGKANAKVLQ